MEYVRRVILKIPLMALITLLYGEQSITGQAWKQGSWEEPIDTVKWEKRVAPMCWVCRIRICWCIKCRLCTGVTEDSQRGESWAGQVDSILHKYSLEEPSRRPELHLTLFFIKWFLNLKLKFKKTYKKNLAPKSILYIKGYIKNFELILHHFGNAFARLNTWSSISV